VTVVNGGWDHHTNIREDLASVCYRTDCGTAALLDDLKSRGLLDSTLVVWGGEFGRLPTIEQVIPKPGRDHNPHGFSIWMAGGGLKSGFDFGNTDELGYTAIDSHKVTHSDVHATILQLLGLDFQKLTFDYEGRAESLIGVNPARVITEILS
jgi:arylsulfatase A-like enzyme